ncbi:hypothetical protein [Telmatospirillum sp. J64-1]|uniref:hypothetical protein n=1 Tax=Telmatospirillum sp. J64-1 TaxID=2502183 RepID=UPI00115F4429|nr:hypothetical protein [Telmatospirillum sp. J64-1]
MPSTIHLIHLGLTLAEAAARGVVIAIEARDLVRRLADEGRDPSPEEWSRLNALSDELHSRIQGEGR